MDSLRQQLKNRLTSPKTPAIIVFAAKQAWSALFGGLLLLAIIFTTYVDLPLPERYDWLFLIAIGLQVAMIALRLEHKREVLVIGVFHLVGLGMELFKTSGEIQSWVYPEEAFFQLGNVPLFSGFMYASVGSYIARSHRVMKLSYTNHPSTLAVGLLSLAIYINFFTHHYITDIRLALFAATLFLFRKTMVSYQLMSKARRMPLLIGFLLIALFIWIGENIGTYTSTWLYPEQLDGWSVVSIQKLGSWLLLMVISYSLVYILNSLEKR